MHFVMTVQMAFSGFKKKWYIVLMIGLSAYICSLCMCVSVCVIPHSIVIWDAIIITSVGSTWSVVHLPQMQITNRMFFIPIFLQSDEIGQLVWARLWFWFLSNLSLPFYSVFFRQPWFVLCTIIIRFAQLGFKPRSQLIDLDWVSGSHWFEWDPWPNSSISCSQSCRLLDIKIGKISLN